MGVCMDMCMDMRMNMVTSLVAEDIVASMTALGGTHTLDDLAATACDYVTPISGTYKAVELTELPPNGQGATAILIANILSHFDIAGMEPFGAERAHIEVEATKLAYDARNRFVADYDHVTRLAHLLDPATARTAPRGPPRGTRPPPLSARR